MKRNEVTTVDKLQSGDRFYKQSSKDKKTFQFIGEESHGKFEVFEAVMAKNGLIANRSHVKIFRGNTAVVFLRNVNNERS
jgi:hypothetical protein